MADKTNWRIYYNRRKSRIPKHLVEKLESNATHAKVTNILNEKDSIYMYDFKNEFIQPIKLTNKQLQRYLRDVHRLTLMKLLIGERFGCVVVPYYFCCGSLLFLLSVFILWFIYYVSDIFCKF